MNILTQEAPPLLISFCLIVAAVVLMALRVVNVLEGMPVLILVAGYWVGNGSARLASQQTMLTPPATLPLEDVPSKGQTALPTLLPVPKTE